MGAAGRGREVGGSRVALVGGDKVESVARGTVGDAQAEGGRIVGDEDEGWLEGWASGTARTGGAGEVAEGA